MAHRMAYRITFRRPRARKPVIVLAEDLDEVATKVKLCLERYFTKTDVIEMEMRDSRRRLLGRLIITKLQ